MFMTKTTLLIMALLLSFSAWAIPYPICKREGDVAKFKQLARTLTNDEAATIVAAQRSYDIERIRRGEERGVACPCDNNNPGLKDLITFIESDFRLIQDELLVQTDQAQERAAEAVRAQVQAACQTREHALHQRLLRESQLAYGSTPAGTQRMDGFNLEGVKGFIRTEGDVKTFAFAGSATPFDWYSNIATKGGSQLRRAMQVQLAAAVQWVKAGKSIQCTGHSLGGGVAEGFCAAVMRRVRQDTANFRDFGDYMSDNRIKVVTFNALGGSHAFRDAVRNTERGVREVPAPVGPNSWLAANTLHYRVEGDPLASVTGTPHLMGTVFEKPANRMVTRTGSNELTAMRNGLASVADVLDDGWRRLWGGEADGHSSVNQAVNCRASEDPLGAHDLASCREILSVNSGWQRSQQAQVEIDARY